MNEHEWVTTREEMERVIREQHQKERAARVIYIAGLCLCMVGYLGVYFMLPHTGGK